MVSYFVLIFQYSSLKSEKTPKTRVFPFFCLPLNKIISFLKTLSLTEHFPLDYFLDYFLDILLLFSYIQPTPKRVLTEGHEIIHISPPTLPQRVRTHSRNGRGEEEDYFWRIWRCRLPKSLSGRRPKSEFLVLTKAKRDLSVL